MSPCVGLNPTTPQNAAGRITEPLVCEPMAPGTMPAATAAAEPLRRAAGRTLGIVRIAGLAGIEIGILGGHGLADDDRAGRAQLRHRRRITPRRAAGPQGRAELGRHVAGIEDVLDADRHAMQRTGRLGRACGGRRRPRPDAWHGRDRGRSRPGSCRRPRRCAARQAATSSAEVMRPSRMSAAASHQRKRAQAHLRLVDGSLTSSRSCRGSPAATARCPGRCRPAPW